MISDRMPIGERGPVHMSLPTRPGNGTSRSWRRDINGVPYSFTAVNMPSGETRLVVTRHNGYPDLRFGCAWSPYKWITLTPNAVTA